jgi:hypothetical protein
MAEARPSVPPATKRALVREAGGKCANPGCPNRLTELHHIREWAVYRTHDAEHMIAICPTCHAHVTRGDLTIKDEKLYTWKKIVRTSSKDRGHLYVEPADEVKLLLGSIAFTGAHAGLLVFELSDSNRLSFALRDGDVVLLNLAVADRRGRPIVKVVDGHVKQLDEEARFEQLPGYVRVTVPAHGRYFARWAVEMMRVHEPTFAADGRLVMLELEVLKPGLVKVQGIWTRGSRSIVITRERLAWVPSPSPADRYLGAPNVSGPGAVIEHIGPITSAVFRLADESEASPPSGPPSPPYMW